MFNFFSHHFTYSRTYKTLFVILSKKIFKNNTKNATISLEYHLYNFNNSTD